MSTHTQVNPPTVSVIIPFFNRANLCLLALQSVLSQTYPHLEILLIDDGSTEDVGPIRAVQDPRVRHFRQENQGPASARNRGLEQAEGELIAFLDADDLWLPNKLERQVSCMMQEPLCLLSHTSYRRIDTDGRSLGTMESGRFTGRVFPKILTDCPIATPSVMLRRATVGHGLRFNTHVKVSEDILFWSSVAALGPILGIDEPLCLVRLQGANASLDVRKQIEGYANIIRHGIQDNPKVDLDDRRLMTGDLYRRMASLSQSLGMPLDFYAFAFQSWLALASPDGNPGPAVESLIGFLDSFIDPTERTGQGSSPMPGTTSHGSGTLALKHTLALPQEALFQRVKTTVLANGDAMRNPFSGSPDGPLFSVLVPTYNQARYLPETLDSLLAQTYGRWEAVVVNDGSTDETPAILEAYAQRDPRFRVFHQPNGGVSSALNHALRQSNGDWICWLSSDDLFQANKLAMHLDAFRNQPDAQFFHTDFLVLDDQSRSIHTPARHHRGLVPDQELQTLEFFVRNYICGISVVAHKSVFQQVGTFNEALKSGQDFDMWLRVSAAFRIAFIENPTCLMRVHPAQGTAVFYAAGILDSALACLDFLDAHGFPSLFPRLDLNQPEAINRVLTATLVTAANADAFITKAGLAGALLNRLREWLTTQCPNTFREAFIDQHNKSVQAIQASGLKEWVKRAFIPIYPSAAPVPYQSLDRYQAMEQHADALRNSGEFTGALDIARYLKGFKSSV